MATLEFNGVSYTVPDFPENLRTGVYNELGFMDPRFFSNCDLEDWCGQVCEYANDYGVAPKLKRYLADLTGLPLELCSPYDLEGSFYDAGYRYSLMFPFIPDGGGDGLLADPGTTAHPGPFPLQFVQTTSDWTRKYNYTYKMDPDGFGFFRTTRKYRKVQTKGELFFGLELEVSTRLSCLELQRIVTDVEPRQEPFFIFKDDSSVTGSYSNRVELVTVPCSPRYLKENLGLFFDKVERLAAEKGKEIKDFFDVSSDLGNGIHIHIGRDSFETLSHLRRFATLFHTSSRKDKDFIQRVSQRPGDWTSSRYCVQNATLPKYRTLHKYKDALESAPRTSALNMCNSSTAEVRVFQGIFDKEHVLSCIECLVCMVNYTQNQPAYKIDKTFSRDMVAYAEQAPHLYSNLLKKVA